MIKRSITLSLNDPKNPEELVLRVQSTTDGTDCINLETFAPKVSIDPNELILAINEAREFQDKHKESNFKSSMSERTSMFVEYEDDKNLI